MGAGTRKKSFREAFKAKRAAHAKAVRAEQAVAAAAAAVEAAAAAAEAAAADTAAAAAAAAAPTRTQLNKWLRAEYEGEVSTCEWCASTTSGSNSRA